MEQLWQNIHHVVTAPTVGGFNCRIGIKKLSELGRWKLEVGSGFCGGGWRVRTECSPKKAFSDLKFYWDNDNLPPRI
jgi:hypothetical protein